MMFCTKLANRSRVLILPSIASRAHYSRRSDKSTNSYKIVKANGESMDDVDNSVFGTNSNWELLTPQGFRFYLPGSVGPGWLDVTTVAQIKSPSLQVYDKEEEDDLSKENTEYGDRSKKTITVRPILHCTAQECPLLLRKGIEELFPGCLDVTAPQLTIVTINQQTNPKTMRWSKEAETEKLTKYFVLAASEVCTRLKMVGYWADFINPFSGQPYLSLQKNNSLYKTDERFRCLGFKIEEKNQCKIISCDTNVKNFIGSLYTTAPASTEFLKEILTNANHE